MSSIFDQDLPRNAANFTPLSPLSFLERAAEPTGSLGLRFRRRSFRVALGLSRDVAYSSLGSDRSSGADLNSSFSIGFRARSFPPNFPCTRTK